MNINWNEVLSSEFWFSIDRTRLHLTDWVIAYGAIGLVVLGIIFLIYKYGTKNVFLKEVARRFATIFITIGVLEAIWFGFRYQLAQALGTRFAAVLIAVVGLVWLYGPIKYLCTRYTTDMAEAQRKMMREKYLQK